MNEMNKHTEVAEVLPSVLYLDDEVQNLKAFKALFRREYNVFIASNIHQATTILGEEDIQILITDQRMPEMTGIEFIDTILYKHKSLVRILLTGYSDVEIISNAISEGKIHRYMAKPYQYEDMRHTLDKAYTLYCEKVC